MGLYYTGGVPTTIDAERLRNILDLNPNDRRLLGAHLARNQPKLWRVKGPDEPDFYQALRTLIATREGVEAWEAAARTVGGQQRGERLSLRVRLEQALAYKINEVVGRDAFVALASELPGQRRALRERLRQAKMWGGLAELIWADLIARRDPDGAFEAISAASELQDLLEEVLAAAEEAPDEAPPAAAPEPWAPVDRPPLPEVEAGEWPELVDELHGRLNDLDRDRLDLGTARTVLAVALALVEVGERAELTLMAERRQAFVAIAEACRALAPEGILADAVGKAEGLVHEVALHIDRWEVWIAELGDAVEQMQRAVEEKQTAQAAFRKASDDAIEDMAALEATLSGLKRARTRAGAAAERLNTLLEQPPEPGAGPAKAREAALV